MPSVPKTARPDWTVDPETAGAREVLPGLWRLRLPLAWPGIDHANAYAIDAVGGGIVLVDCGTAGDPSHIEALDHALGEAGRSVDDVQLLVGTHAHADHIGLAGELVERTGCEFWTHPSTAPLYDGARDPQEIFRRRASFARSEGVPREYLATCADTSEETDAVARPLEPHVALREGMTIPTALGPWTVLETPGHAPSQVCLLQPEHRAMIVGDLVCAAFGPWFDIGYSRDPYGEWQHSLARIEELGGVDVALPGHGRPIVDQPGLLRSYQRDLVGRLEAVRAAVRKAPGSSGWEITELALGPVEDARAAVLAFDETLAYLRHLSVQGEVVRTVERDRATHHPA